MFISLRQNGKLAKPGTQRAMLFSPREDDKLPLSEVQSEVHDMVKREYMGKKDVSVTRVTYLKPPPAANRDAELLETFVDKFGRIVEETTRGGVRRILVKDEVEAAGTKERVRPGARRDPFRKDLALMYNAKGGQGPEISRSRLPIHQHAGDVRQDGSADRRDAEGPRGEAGRGRPEGLRKVPRHPVGDPNMTNLGQKPLPPEQMARVDALRKQAEEAWGGLERLMKALQGHYVRVIDSYNRDECDVMEQGIGELKKAQSRKSSRTCPSWPRS
jgi:hypothetical protein